MRIYKAVDLFLENSTFYFLTTNDGRIIVHGDVDKQHYYKSLIALIEKSRTLKTTVTAYNINDHNGFYCELIVEFKSLWKIEEEYPEILI